MKLKALITSVVFVGALFTGSALAADTGTAGDPAGRDAQSPGVYGQDQQDPQAGQGREADQDRQAGVFGQDDQDEIAGMHKADDLMNESVVGQAGEDLGSIDNLVISENGQVEFIILSRGGVMGMGGDLVAVPWDAANLQKDQDDQLRADITEQQLEGAPTFENYAEIASPEYEQQVHSYFGTEARGQDGFGTQEGLGTQPESPEMQESPQTESPRTN
jgi:sporulation protein YlmC with PRC-barrel domain